MGERSIIGSLSSITSTLFVRVVDGAASEILLRLIPTASHTLEDVEYTIESFKKVKTKLEAGEYKAEKILNMG